MQRAALLTLLALLAVSHPRLAAAQLSKPITHDHHVDEAGNKFLQREASADSTGHEPHERDEDDLFECPLNVELSWMTEVSSSIYSTPIITDLFSDGAKEVIVPSFVHYLEVLEAADGAVSTGWPAFHKSSTHASPVLTDVDFDGVQDIALATYDGEIIFFKDNGEEIGDRLYVPRLRVRKRWHEGLAPDHVDHSHPDVQDPEIAHEAEEQNAKLEKAMHHDEGLTGAIPAPQPEKPRRKRDAAGARREEGQQPQQDPEAGGAPPQAEKAPEQQPVEALQPPQADPSPPNVDAVRAEENKEAATTRRRHLLDVEATVENQEEIDEDAEKSFRLFKEDDYSDDDYNEKRHHYEEEYEEEYKEHEGDYNEYEQLEEDYNDEDYVPFRDERKEHRWNDHYEHDYDGFAGDDFWEDEDFEERVHEKDDTFVFVDAHILCTPTIADLDGDGHDEMIVAVSYFYDREYYAEQAHAEELGRDINTGNYLATGIVVFELHSRKVKWSQHLDLSTDYTRYRAYMYSSPTVADIDLDGKLEVIIGTSVGFLYVLDNTGEPREGWPVQMGEIQGQVLVADVNGDGFLELFAGDTRGNIALFNSKGHELWERHISSTVAQMATAGDINGDGALEIVFGTGLGHIYAVSGKTGQDVANFPFKTGGRVMAPVLIIQLDDSSRAQHLVVPSFDGHLYMVNGITGCADSVDVGETSYAMVLADDLNGNGRMDLLLSTMNGNVYRFETPSKYHPQKVWSSQTQGRNNFVSKHEYQGVYATPASRAPRDVRGQDLSIRFEIVDNRPKVASVTLPGESAPKQLRGPYTVSVTLQGVGVDEMNMGDQPVIGMVDTFKEPGQYELVIPCPRTRSTATVSIEMMDESKVLFTDSFSLSFHMHFYRLLKWMLLLPFTMMAAVILAMAPGSGIIAEAALPSFTPTRSHEA